MYLTYLFLMQGILQRRVMYSVVIVMTISSFGSALWQALFSIYLEELGISYVNIGLSTSILFMLPAVLALPAGIMSDIMNKKGLMVLALTANGFIVFLLPLAKNIEILIALILLYGFLSGLSVQSAISLVAYASTATYRATAFAIYYFAIQISSTLGTFMSGPLIEYYGYDILYLLASISYFISAALAWIIMPSLGLPKSNTKLYENLNRLGKILKERRLRLLIITVILHDLSVFIAMPFTALFAKDILSLDKSKISAILGIRNASLMMTQIASGRLADMFGGGTLLTMHIMLTSALNVAYGLSNTLADAVIIMVISGFVFSLDMPARRALISLCAPEDLIATINGVADTMVGIFAILTPILGGYLWQMGYKREVFIVSGLCNLMALPFVIILSLEERRRSKQYTSVQGNVNISYQ
ncbi:MAG: hypothetical protein DRZ82_03945 [Thermoprotei archaeon]|nr:MAG: hypothetical protein DRZ82_03945 [Thermoprotei archaeon]